MEHLTLGLEEKISTQHGFIDDATGAITGLYMCKNECLLGYNEVLRQTLTLYGIPQSLYPDRYLQLLAEKCKSSLDRAG